MDNLRTYRSTLDKGTSVETVAPRPFRQKSRVRKICYQLLLVRPDRKTFVQTSVKLAAELRLVARQSCHNFRQAVKANSCSADQEGCDSQDSRGQHPDRGLEKRACFKQRRSAKALSAARGLDVGNTAASQPRRRRSSTTRRAHVACCRWRSEPSDDEAVTLGLSCDRRTDCVDKWSVRL